MDFIEAKKLTYMSNFTLDTSTPEASSSGLHPIDGVVIDNLLTDDECAHLVDAAEQSGGFAFWDSSGEERRALRNADTLEFEDVDFCAALWSRLAPFVPPRASFAPDDADERYEPDLAGDWFATGLNPHLLLNRYGADGHFAPHADGSTLVDFNRRSLYTVLIYLNVCAEGGETQVCRRR